MNFISPTTMYFVTLAACVAVVIYVEFNAMREQAKLNERIQRDGEIIRKLRAELADCNKVIGHGAGIHVMSSHRNKGQSK